MAKRGPRRHRKGRRDFWRAWREERQRLWEEYSRPPEPPPPGPHPPGPPPPPGPHPRGGPPPGPPPPEVARAWREFFRSYMGEWPERHWAFGGRRFNPWHQGIDTFNPFVASLLSKGGGLLPLVVLHLLSQRPRYGNEIMDLITESTGGRWVANPGAIYPLLRVLEERGLIEGKWEDPDRRTIRIYRLTGAGEQELARLKAIVRPKLDEAIEVLQRLTQELDSEESEGEEEAADNDAPQQGT